MKFEEKFMKHVINSCLEMDKLLTLLTDEDYYPDSSCFCPFHENFNTKSAKLYSTPSRSTLYCFSEGKTYRPVDAILKLSNVSLQSAFDTVWEKLTEEQKKDLEASVETSRVQVRQFEELADFAKGRMSIDEVKNLLVRSLNNAEGSKEELSELHSEGETD